MAFLQFPYQGYFRVLESDSVTEMGNFQIPTATELKSMMLTLFIRGVIPDPFKMRMSIFGDLETNVPIYQSEWAELSMDSFSPPYTDNWIGNIYIDFEQGGAPLNPNLVYYMKIETDGYTRAGNSYYVSFNLDWYQRVYESPSPTEAGARIRILGVK